MNEIIRQTAPYPTEYTFQKLAIQRELMTSQTDLKHFIRNETGTEGERKFKTIFNQFGQRHWSFMQNLWLHDFADFECDYVLMTNHCVYVFEIKNYFGKFEYRNGECSSRGVAITYNPINQARNTTIHLRNLLSPVPVKGALVFIGEHNQVEIADEIEYIDILCRNDIYQYIQDIIVEENNNKQVIDSRQILNVLESHSIKKPYQLVPYSKEQTKAAKTGVSCCRCNKFELTKKKSYFRCVCGQYESIEEAIVRSTCEYGVLTYGKKFTVTEIHHFINKAIARVSLIKVLDKHFELDPTQSILTYRNYNEPYAAIRSQFTFKSRKYIVEIE